MFKKYTTTIDKDKVTITYSPKILRKAKNMKHFLKLLNIDRLIKHREEIGLTNDDHFVRMNELDYIELRRCIFFRFLMKTNWSKKIDAGKYLSDNNFTPLLSTDIPPYTVIFQPGEIDDDAIFNFNR